MNDSDKPHPADVADRGRPCHEPTPEGRERVAVLAGGGMPTQDIALVMGISVPTLRKHYEDDLSLGAATKRAEVLEAMRQAAVVKGNVAAAKLYLAHDVPIAVPPIPGEEVEETAPAEKLGKKAQADADAQTAANGTEWGDLLRSGTVVPIRR